MVGLDHRFDALSRWSASIWGLVLVSRRPDRGGLGLVSSNTVFSSRLDLTTASYLGRYFGDAWWAEMGIFNALRPGMNVSWVFGSTTDCDLL